MLAPPTHTGLLENNRVVHFIVLIALHGDEGIV